MPALETDEEKRLCLHSNVNLPPTVFIASGNIASSEGLDDVGLFVCGFKETRPAGCARRNALHAAVMANDCGRLRSLFDETAGVELVALLAQQDWSGATPFFIAMQVRDIGTAAFCIRFSLACFAEVVPFLAVLQQGKLKCAIEIQRKVTELTASTPRHSDLLAKALYEKNMHSTPPLHALLGLSADKNSCEPRAPLFCSRTQLHMCILFAASCLAAEAPHADPPPPLPAHATVISR